ncbi:TPA: TIGR03745 family integrating conjugative element membrane protein [Pasteurella multocida]|uniref:TIGR03745 family integrating conjugative element membrane protein n=1 Tax=Pasteurella multocida TaxID=747 RepID=UPI002020DC98|nr:TIGR03745 family integrating conjugative element membrane protein [Pasteurella multocida]MCL7827374.1 TIGR03745 family integrating conjugative element membrane protein [Pasteurella multocida]HDR1435564.1 TIGR03745 family integrating conjugative element membrane protein [Pasteurella multocida]HDR1793422.1 TIGR03745 family integrating conjugative element membrane protein [Pasteurella multocida]HDR1868177.1 TIGR03745 family integrating conjugative element membrane protein [Pasteurella multocida
MKLLQKTTAMYQRIQLAALSLFISLIGTNPALAALPKLEDPTRGKGNGFMDTIKNYIYDGIILFGLLLAAGALYVVASSAIGTYKDVTSGSAKKTWGEFILQVIVGIVLIVIVIWLATKASEIL